MQYLRILLTLTAVASPVLSAPLRVLRATRAPAPTAIGPTVDLGSPQTVPVGARLHRYYPQQIGGVPVLGCGVDEVVEANGDSAVQNATLCATAATVATSVTGGAAAAIARGAIAKLHPAQGYVVNDAVAAYAPGGTPVWLVDVATTNPWNLWRVFVDGVTGATPRIISLAKDVRGSVFPTPGAVESKRPSVKRLRDLDAGAVTLSGSDFVVDDVNDYLALCDVTSKLFCTPAAANTCAATRRGGMFQYSPVSPVQIGSCTENDKFDQVTAYYGLSEMASYFRSLGFEPGSGALAGHFPLPVVVNLPYLVNAYFVGPTQKWPAHMAFGDEATGVDLKDFTNDPTVPRHEFTHAVVHDAAGGINDVDTCINNCSPYAGAMNEGFADYFAIQSLGGKQTIVGSQLGGYLGSDVARDIKNELRFPCDIAGEVHADGRIWSAFLRDVKGVVGRGFDSAVAQSIANIPHGLAYSLGFSEAFEAVLGELPTLSDKSRVAVIQHATRRGVIGAFAKDRGDSVTIDSGDSAWTCAAGSTCGVLTDDDSGASAASINTPPGFAGGLAARVTFDPTSPMDLRSKQLLHFEIYAAPTPAAGSFSLVFDDNLDCASPTVTLPLPAFDPGQFTERYLQFTGADGLGAVLCVGLLAPAGSNQILVNQIDTGTSQFGPVVVPIQAEAKLALANYFPLPHGDTHFYYFLAPPTATKVTVKAHATGLSQTRSDLTYCGAVNVSGTGDIPAEIAAMHLWAYDPSQPLLPIQLTLLPLDSHQLIAAVPAFGKSKRAVRALPLPPSASGVYAVSIEGVSKYKIKLSFD